MPTTETAKEFNKRLWREGRYPEFKAEVDKMVVREGVSVAAARKALAPEYPPLTEEQLEAKRRKRERQEKTRKKQKKSTAADSGSRGLGGGVAPRETSPPPPSSIDWAPEAESHWEILDWVAEAFGLESVGVQVETASCPGPKAWAVLDWARKNRKDFYALWAAECRRNLATQDEEAAEKRQMRRSAEEIERMLAEELADDDDELQQGVGGDDGGSGGD